MLEILLIILVGQRVAKIATEKGLPKTWALLVLLIPVMGIGAGLVALIIIAITGVVPQELMTLAAIPFYLGAEGLTAWLILNFMKKRPAGMLPVMPVAAAAPGVLLVPPVAMTPVAETGESLAGYCSECEANKWLAADCSCPEGHPASCVSNVYSAPRTVS